MNNLNCYRALPYDLIQIFQKIINPENKEVKSSGQVGGNLISNNSQSQKRPQEIEFDKGTELPARKAKKSDSSSPQTTPKASTSRDAGGTVQKQSLSNTSVFQNQQYNNRSYNYGQTNQNYQKSIKGDTYYNRNRQIKCFNCGKDGHKQVNCPELTNRRDQVGRGMHSNRNFNQNSQNRRQNN